MSTTWFDAPACPNSASFFGMMGVASALVFASKSCLLRHRVVVVVPAAAAAASA